VIYRTARTTSQLGACVNCPRGRSRPAGTWLLLVSGGGPTADKPTVVFQPPADADLVSHAMTLRVTDCQAAYEALRSRGAAFLTPPHDWGSEIRCFLRDPDGHLVEISQSKAS
jgi:catechol 2,3-dioxygenase-like lactoylglutathione lyase family enzyme